MTGIGAQEIAIATTALVYNSSTQCYWLDPRVDCYVTPDVEVGVVSYLDKVIDAVKTKRLSDLASGKGSAVLQCAVIAAKNVISISLARPPRYLAAGRWPAGDGHVGSRVGAGAVVDRPAEDVGAIAQTSDSR